MAKYCGMIGYSIGKSNPDRPGVITPSLVEKKYYGDILEDKRRWENGNKINDDLDISNRISVLIDDFAIKNLGAIKYATFMGTRWNIKSVSISHPRMILDLGGIYNGPRPKEGSSQETREDN